MDQKLENILNLALETPEEEREQTESLNVGYSAETRSWELIVKYHGSLDRLREQNIVVEELIAGYAILTVPEALVDTVSDTPEIEYVEKPKRFYYGQTFPAGTSCFPPVTMRTPFLNGRGVLLAVLDSGITWDLEVFRKADGSTRIRYLWDQTVSKKTGECKIRENAGWIFHRDGIYRGGNKCGITDAHMGPLPSDPKQRPIRTWNSGGRDCRREKCGWSLYRGSTRGGTDRGEAGIAGEQRGRRRRIPPDNRNPAWSDLCAVESQAVKYATCHQSKLWQQLWIS